MPGRPRVVLEVTCDTCGRKYLYDSAHRKGHKKTQCNSCSVNGKNFLKRKARKQQAVEALGGKCQYCGYNRSVAALEFHHTRDKSFEIGDGLNRSWKVIQEELEKCILICSNCHAELHELERDITWPVPQR